jgi:hypothetical protein
MTARDGMADLITELRALCEAGTADYAIDGTDFWTDDQLQASLDRFRNDIYYDELLQIPTYNPAGAMTFQTYRARFMDLESGTALIITDTTGGTAGTADYTVDAVRGIITFSDDTAGLDYYLSGRAYNLNAAAADIWRKKAGHYAGTFNFTAGSNSMSRSQIYDHCLERAEFYERTGSSTAESGEIERSDTPGGWME